jgi:hypothetical protein
MQPIVHGLETEFQGKMVFERRNANVGVGIATMDAYGLRAHPSYVIAAPDGKALWSYTGQVSAERLREQISRYIH